jgi:hypothetical protein
MTLTASFHKKKFTDPDGLRIPGTNTGPFLWNGSLLFLLIFAPFLLEAVEDSQCYFFEN